MPGVPWLQWMNFHYSDGRHRNALKAHFFVARSSDFGVALTSLRHAIKLLQNHLVEVIAITRLSHCLDVDFEWRLRTN